LIDSDQTYMVCPWVQCASYDVWGKTLRWKAIHSRKRYLVLQVKCP